MNKRIIAITSCAKTKKDYPCSVREMFSDSTIFLARQLYLDKTYDEWFVWDEDDGLLHPDQIIEPYGNLYINERSYQVTSDTEILSKERILKGIETLKQQYPDTDNIEVHCHLSNSFISYLAKVFKHIIHIRPQKTFPETAWRYHDAILMLDEGKSREECNAFIDKRKVSTKPKEEPRWFYHPEHDPIFGNSWDLWLANQDSIPKSHLPELFALCIGRVNISHGWVSNPDYVKHIKKNPKRYSLNKRAIKDYVGVDKSMQRRGIKEALLKLASLK